MGVEGFGDQIRRYRQAAGMTQEALAERSGLSVRGISDLERGLKQRPHPETVRLLAEALALDVASVAALREAANPAPRFEPVALPAPLTSLIGRDDERRAIGAMLQPGGDVRLVTLTGPGGVGKTRLAIELATAARSHFEDGVAFAALAALNAPSQVLPAIVAAFDIRDSSGRSPVELVVRHLQGRQVLAVLDNMEHLLDAVPDIAALLERCPGLMVLATSRSPLQIAGERAYRIKPLALPVISRQLSAESAGHSPAVRLFVDRANAIEPEFQLDGDNAPAIADICVRLDGLPLALELAAGRMNVLSPSDLATMLGRRLDLLTGGARTLPTRHQTVRATIAWSHDLLSDGERETFRRFAVFAGGATREAAAAVIGDGDDIATLDQLSALVGRSLIQRVTGVSGETRFVMLETIREFALERMAESADEEAIRDFHAAWFLGFAEQGDEGLTGPDQAVWMKRLREDDANLQAALTWSIGQGDASSSQRAASALWNYLATSGRLREAQGWLDRALALGPEAVTPERARALLRQGNIAIDLADYPTALSAFESSLAILVGIGDEFGACGAMSGLGLAQWSTGDASSARRNFEKTLAVCRERGWDRGVGTTLLSLGRIAIGEDAFDAARLALDEAWHIAVANTDPSACAYLALWLGSLDRYQDRLTEAQAQIDMALDGFRQHGDRVGISLGLLEHGRIAYDLGRRDEAREHLVASMLELEEAGATHFLVDCLETLALVEVSEQRESLGLSLIAGAQQWRDSHHCPRTPVADRAMQGELERLGIAPAPPDDGALFAPSLSTLVQVASTPAIRGMAGDSASPASTNAGL